MKRAALKRGKPLARKGQLRRSAIKRKRAKGQPAVRSDRAYLSWVRTQPCCMTGVLGPNHAHHPRTGAGIGIKSSDAGAISLNHEAHMALHALNRWFAGWTREELRAWEARHSKRLRAIYEARNAFPAANAGEVF